MIFSGWASFCLFLLFRVPRWGVCIDWIVSHAWWLVYWFLALFCWFITHSQTGFWALRGSSGLSCGPQSIWLRTPWLLPTFSYCIARSIPCTLPQPAGNSSSRFLALPDDSCNFSPSTAEAPSFLPPANLLSSANYRINSSVFLAYLLYLFS